MENVMNNVVMDPVPCNHPVTILACSPVVKEPGTLPYRIVLIDNGENLVVWHECWKQYEENPLKLIGKSHHLSGNYFDRTELSLAMERFAERVKRQAKTVLSISR